jgi:Ubiquitin carboxyl-terminal hydrolase
LEQQQMLAPLERMAAVRPLWQSLTPEEREAALTVPLDDLRAYAKELAARHRAASEAELAEAAAAGQVILTFDPTLDEVLDEGLERSKASGTWKVWHWPPDKAEFKDTEAFKEHMEEHLLGPEHRAVLPKEVEGSRPLEQPNEAAFRKRMQELLISVQEQRLAQDEEVAAASRRPGARRQDPLVVMRDASIELIITMLTALEREHDAIYQHCLTPVTTFICDALPEGSYKTTRNELYPEDLESLLPDDIQHIFDFLTEKLDTLSTRLKSDAAELELEDQDEEPIGDVDLFSLTPDGTALCVNDKWMSHLRSRVLGEDSQPRQAKEGEDPTKAGLALEWVYGTIVSTAEKGRDAAHRIIAGSKAVSPEEAVESLVNALEEQALWEQHARSSRELLSQMLASRKEAGEMKEKYDLHTQLVTVQQTASCDGTIGDISNGTSNGIISKPVNATSNASSASNGEATSTAAVEDSIGASATTAAATPEGQLPSLPPHVILFLLKREALLTAAKLHGLKLEQATAKRELRSYQAQLRAGEPRFERLRRDLDEMKTAPSRSLDGTYRNTSEMERHRSQLADAAIEEQITAQAEFRKIGSRLQKTVQLKSDIEMQISRRDQEANQLQLWRRNVCQMLESLEDHINAAAPLDSLLLADGGVGVDGAVDEEAGEIDDAKRALVAAVKVATRHAEEVETLINSFNNTFRKELYVAADDIAIFETVQNQLKEIERRLDDGKVAIQHLLQFAINVACDDPGITIGQNIVLPYLQEKLDLKGLEWANEKAAAAQDEVIRMEFELEDKQRQEREKKAKAKAKAKEKARNEKERERVDKEARERQAREAEEEAKRAAEAVMEEARKKRAAEIEALRLAEEELMERRRKELLADEDSHWRQRSEQDDELRSAQAELEQRLVTEEESTKGADGIKGVDGGHAAATTRGKDDGFIAAGASNASKRNANRRSKEKEQSQQQQQEKGGEQPRKHKDSIRVSGTTKARALPNGRGKDATKSTANANPPPSVSPTTSTEPIPPINIAASGSPAADFARSNSMAAASGSPLAPSSPDRVESAQPASIQPTPAVGTSAPPSSASLNPDQQQLNQQHVQQFPAPAAAGMVPLHAVPAAPGMMMMPLPPPGMLPVPVVGLPPVPGVASVMPPPTVFAAAAGVPPPVIPSHSRSGSAFSGANGEEVNSPTALLHGPLPTPPPPPPPRRNQQQQQHMYAAPGGQLLPPPPLPSAVVGAAAAPYNGVGPPPPHPNMFYPPCNEEPPLPPHMMRPGGPLPHPAMGYVVPPPPPPPGAPHHGGGGAGNGGAGMMHPHPHSYHMQHGGMMQPPPGVALGRPYHPQHQHQQQQLPYHAAPLPSLVSRQMQNGGGSSLAASFASRQLRAAAQPFVPSSNSFSMQESGGAGNGGAEGSAAAPPAASDPKEQQLGVDDGNNDDESSPRGILEPAELAGANSAQRAGGGLVGTTSNGTASSTAGDEAASEEAGSNISDAGPANGGGSEAGQQEQMLAMVGNGNGKAAPAAAQAEAPPAVDLKTVRGLSNSPGVYNCFLNVIIQSLWHLPAFRKSLLSLTPAELKNHTATAAAADGKSDNDAEVLSSLRAIFEELNSNTSSSSTTIDENDDADDSLPLKPVSPHQLRAALGGSRFDHGNMHDAAEVLGELFDRLHVAEVGSTGRDPTLPRTVRVDAASRNHHNSNKKARSTGAAEKSEFQPVVVPAIAKDSAWGNAAALKMVKKALALADAEGKGGAANTQASGSAEKKEVVSMVQRLFGMEVQAPLHTSSNGTSNGNGNLRSSGASNDSGKGGKAGKSGEKTKSSTAPSTVEVLQYTRYFHLVPAQGLRIAAATAPSFEAALVAATAGGTTPPTERLLRKPAVFTLSTVFESPQVPAPALAATLSALRPELDVSKLFFNSSRLDREDEEEDKEPKDDGFNYRLRCMVCYSSSHYFAFAFSEEVGQWLLLDDAHVSAVGHWKDVQATAAQRRLQPSLLFYEALPSSASVVSQSVR